MFPGKVDNPSKQEQVEKVLTCIFQGITVRESSEKPLEL